MTMILANILSTGIPLNGLQRLMMMLPLCLSIAIIYKSTRCENMREVPAAALVLWVTIVLGMFAVGVGLFILFNILV